MGLETVSDGADRFTAFVEELTEDSYVVGICRRPVQRRRRHYLGRRGQCAAGHAAGMLWIRQRQRCKFWRWAHSDDRDHQSRPATRVDDTPYNHYSLLRTTEEALGIDEFLGHANDQTLGVKAMTPLFAVP
jgi:hypothetical protein